MLSKPLSGLLNSKFCQPVKMPDNLFPGLKDMGIQKPFKDYNLNLSDAPGVSTGRLIKIIDKLETQTKENPIPDKKKKITGICNEAKDITGIKLPGELQRHSESNLTAIIENNDAFIYSMDKQFRYIIFNKAHKNVMKNIYNLDIKPGDKVSDFLKKLDPPEAAEWKRIYSKAMKGKATQFVKQFKVHDYTNYSSFSITPIFEDNHVVGLSCYVRDVTAEKVAAEALYNSEANLRIILENTNTAFVLLDDKANVLSFNLMAKKLALQEMKESLEVGKNYLKLLKDKRSGEVAKIIKSVLDTGKQINYEVKTVSGETAKWLLVSMNPVFNLDKKVTGLSVAAVDITEEKNARLEKEKMTTDVILRNKDLEQFAYIISHNLRSPVANIIGLSHLIMNSTGLKAKDHAKCMEGLVLSVKKLDNVIIDLNYILQVRREINEKKESVRFSAIVKDIKTSINNIIEKQNISIKTNFIELNSFFTIKSYIHSIFYNLILNSIKYRRTDMPGQIRITSKKIKDKLILSFKDNGMGIDMAANEKQVFGLYKKFHANIEGKGMGLYMTKTQVEMLGGTIKIKSAVNKGTEIIIEFKSSQG
jgi:PAS domain S-box-containing protein